MSDVTGKALDFGERMAKERDVARADLAEALEVLRSWRRLAHLARHPRKDSNTSFVDTRDLYAFLSDTDAILSKHATGGAT